MVNHDQCILARYPKERPLLTERHERVYSEEMRINRGGAGLVCGMSSRLETWMHKKISRRGGDNSGPALELGAGQLNHVRYECSQFTYDALEPLGDLCRFSRDFDRIRHLFTSYEQLADIKQTDGYGRIFSTAVLEHLEDLPLVVAHSGRLLSEPEGLFQAGIPTQGGFLWGLGWRVVTGSAYRIRTGSDYGTVMRHEHINTSSEIEAIVKYFFHSVVIQRFPLPSKHMSIYTYIEARCPNRTTIADYLNKRSSGNH